MHVHVGCNRIEPAGPCNMVRDGDTNHGGFTSTMGSWERLGRELLVLHDWAIWAEYASTHLDL